MSEELHMEESSVYETPLLSEAGEFVAQTQGLLVGSTEGDGLHRAF
jgi:hypothetical protein